MRLAFALALVLAVPAAAQKRLTPVESPPAFLADHEARVRLVLKEAFAPDVTLRAIVRPSFQVEYAVGLRRGAAGFEIFALWPSRQIWEYESIKLMQSGRMGAFVVEGLLDDALMGAPEKREGKPRRGKRPKRAGGDSKPAEATADLLHDLADEERTGAGEIRDVTGEKIAQLQEGLPENPADLPLTRCAVPVGGTLAAALIAAWRRMLAEVGPDPRGQGADGTDYSFAMMADGRILEGATWSPRPRTRPARLAELAETMRGHCQTPDPARLQRIEALARQLRGRAKSRTIAVDQSAGGAGSFALRPSRLRAWPTIEPPLFRNSDSQLFRYGVWRAPVPVRLRPPCHPLRPRRCTPS